jgi:hypothetical protein
LIAVEHGAATAAQAQALAQLQRTAAAT